MQNRENLFLRNDTIFGVCEGIGQDLGFHPNWLRVALCILLFLSPVGAIAVYLGLGIMVFSARMLFPSKASTAAPAVALSPADPANNDGESLPVAA